ncbi:hypothetical protein SO802_026818 [Lithocarpus litseifolius]|uniref:Uncharacterized protein n=1 Tax=Lithocarpus litseifolius TaxID=425828 RepID=A0AAW2C2T7_9ROSI
MPQHNHLSTEIKMPCIHLVVQLVSGKEVDHHQYAKAIFLMELRERTYIDISAHAYSIIAKATRITSRAKLVLPSLIIWILHEKGVETPQDISLMSVPFHQLSNNPKE